MEIPRQVLHCRNPFTMKINFNSNFTTSCLSVYHSHIKNKNCTDYFNFIIHSDIIAHLSSYDHKDLLKPKKMCFFPLLSVLVLSMEINGNTIPNQHDH